MPLRSYEGDFGMGETSLRGFSPSFLKNREGIRPLFILFHSRKRGRGGEIASSSLEGEGES